MSCVARASLAASVVACFLPVSALPTGAALVPISIRSYELDDVEPTDKAESGKGKSSPEFINLALTSVAGSSVRTGTGSLSSGGNSILELVQWHGDLFTNRFEDIVRKALFHESREFTDWAVLFLCIISMFLIDTFVMRRWTRDCGFGTHVVILLFWIFIALCFGIWVNYRHGTNMACQWCSGYVLEWLLSMDNLFIFHLVFRAFATPEGLLHKALFVGILSAVVLRMVFFVMLHNLLHMHQIFHYAFGVLLIYSGAQAALDSDDDEQDPRNSNAVRWLKKILGERLLDDYDHDKSQLFVQRNGKRCATLLVPVIACLEVWDIIFAVDSVSAKVAQIPDQFMNYSSSVFAMFALRAMFFIIHDLVKYFELMKYGLCLILTFIGIELFFSDYIKLPASSVFILIVSVFAICAVASVVKSVVCAAREARLEASSKEPEKV